jgi:hypothetical protein
METLESSRLVLRNFIFVVNNSLCSSESEGALIVCCSLFSDLRNLSGTALMNLLAALFMAQLLYVIGVGGVQVTTQ